jgi:hypothetical protein
LGELFEYLKKEKSKTFSKTSNISSKGSIITQNKEINNLGVAVSSSFY